MTSNKSLSTSIFHPALVHLGSKLPETSGEICPNTVWLALLLKVQPMGPHSSGKTLFYLYENVLPCGKEIEIVMVGNMTLRLNVL